MIHGRKTKKDQEKSENALLDCTRANQVLELV